MQFKLIIKDANFTGATLIIDEISDNPMFIGCRFSHCKILVREKNMMKIFGQCIFDETCDIEYGA